MPRVRGRRGVGLDEVEVGGCCRTSIRFTTVLEVVERGFLEGGFLGELEEEEGDPAEVGFTGDGGCFASGDVSHASKLAAVLFRVPTCVDRDTWVRLELEFSC